MAKGRSSKKPPARSRPARVMDWLLVASVAFVGVVAAGYVWLPEVQRAAATAVQRVSDAAGWSE